MKKLLIILVASFFLVQSVDAQLFQWGIKAGLGLNSLKIADLTDIQDGSDVYDMVTGDNVMGYHIGFQTRINIAMIFIQPELYFNDGGAKIEEFKNDALDATYNVNFQRIDLPLLVGVKLGPARINIGPVGSYVVKESVTGDVEDLDPDYTFFSQSMTWGYQVGLGLDISKISIDARYEGSLSSLGEAVNIGGNSYALDARPSQWVFSLGFWFR
ncbi:MAG: porin family protein [Bacteroides sp.]|nr:porin family protein [Bacteroides sp.]